MIAEFQLIVWEISQVCFCHVYKFSGCFGPQLGHITTKCTKLKYEGETVREFEIYLKEIKGFKEVLWKRDKERKS